MRELAFIVPGRLDQLTGGYLYDRHIVTGLLKRGRAVKVIEVARNADDATLAAIADGTPTVIDGLALPSLEEAVAAQGSRLRLIALIHHSLAEETGLTRAASQRLAALEAAMLPRFRGVLCPSRQTAAAVERCGVSLDRIAVVPPGTTKSLHYQRLRRDSARALLCVASLIQRKGHCVLVEALTQIRNLDWNLLCVGSLERDPATTRAVRRMISAAGFERRITLAGEWPPNRVTGAYRAADIFVLPSFHEGYGMAYAEAMAHGLPIIATTAGAIPETVPREAGLFVAPDDPAALARALRRVIAEPGLAARLAAASRATGASLPEWPQATEEWEKALDRLAALNLPP